MTLWLLHGIGHLVLFEPLIDPFLHIILPIPVALLNFALKLVTTSLDIQKVVVRKVAPFLFQFALELFPFAVELILVED